MACHELIASQRGLGWQACDRLYEDKGVSGSHLERPGLEKLLADDNLRDPKITEFMFVNFGIKPADS